MTRTILASLTVALLIGCQPGYIKPSELKAKGQGPEQCQSRCRELGMEMGALVLLGDQLPGCVCQPAGAPASPGSKGASATGAGYVVIAAAAAAAQQNHQQQLQQQTTYRPR